MRRKFGRRRDWKHFRGHPIVRNPRYVVLCCDPLLSLRIDGILLDIINVPRDDQLLEYQCFWSSQSKRERLVSSGEVSSLSLWLGNCVHFVQPNLSSPGKVFEVNFAEGKFAPSFCLTVTSFFGVVLFLRLEAFNYEAIVLRSFANRETGRRADDCRYATLYPGNCV